VATIKPTIVDSLSPDAKIDAQAKFADATIANQQNTADAKTTIAEKKEDKVVEQKDPAVEKKEEKIPPQNVEPVVSAVQKPVEKEAEKKAAEIVVVEQKMSDLSKQPEVNVHPNNVSFDFSRPDLGVSSLNEIPLTPKVQQQMSDKQPEVISKFITVKKEEPVKVEEKKEETKEKRLEVTKDEKFQSLIGPAGSTEQTT